MWHAYVRLKQVQCPPQTYYHINRAIIYTLLMGVIDRSLHLLHYLGLLTVAHRLPANAISAYTIKNQSRARI